MSWSSYLLFGSVVLLILCFGLSFCAARHKPTNPHTDPLRIWQSRYSQSIHAYASPKTTTLSIVTVCWSRLLRARALREYATADVRRSSTSPAAARNGTYICHRAHKHPIHSRAPARKMLLRVLRRAGATTAYVLHIFFNLDANANFCANLHRFNAWFNALAARLTPRWRWQISQRYNRRDVFCKWAAVSRSHTKRLQMESISEIY